MLIPQQISIIAALILAHCTLIVWSVSLIRSVSLVPTSSNVNKFVPLAESKFKNITQPTEARTFSSLKENILIDHARKYVKELVHLPKELARVVLLFTKPGLIIFNVMEKNPMRPGPIKYFGKRRDKYWQNIADINYPSFLMFGMDKTKSKLFTSTLPTLVTNGNSSTSDNYITTEWPRIDKVEPRVFAIGCIFCLEYGELSFPARCFWDVVEKAIKARNSVVGTVSRPFNWSTDKFFTGLETLYGHALKLILKTKKMFKSKCEQDSSCELD
uniref:Uncharacterized protein n=1 Tax=Tetranychus urticae TaxID=32264 RepID=T1KH26_TETUR